MPSLFDLINHIEDFCFPAIVLTLSVWIACMYFGGGKRMKLAVATTFLVLVLAAFFASDILDRVADFIGCNLPMAGLSTLPSILTLVLYLRQVRKKNEAD